MLPSAATTGVFAPEPSPHPVIHPPGPLAEDATAAQSAAEMSRELYAGGLKDFLTVLDSERTQLSAQNSLVQSDATVAENLVRLYRAMGGGWR